VARILPKGYKVLFTPLISDDTYGDTVDVTSDVDLSDYIKNSGIGKIKRDIDNGDYDIGVFTYANITLKGINQDGIFNTADDYRSIFNFTRDKCKVEVKYDDGLGTSFTSFRGIINDEATRLDFKKNEVRFKVLSEDSILRKTKVSGGLIATGTTFKTAIERLLNQTDITSILTFDANEIEVSINLTIDDGTWFTDKSTKDALDALLVVSNSVMIVEDSVMIVRTREENTGTIHKFYGEGDLLGRENIEDIKEYNTGMQRAFNAITFNDSHVENTALIKTFGLREKIINYGFITDDTKKAQIAQNILNEFKAPKIELEINVPTNLAKNINFFDLVSVDYPYIIKPWEDNRLALFGVSKYGTAVYPHLSGGIRISSNTAFKVVGVKEDTKNFMTLLKLRQRGTDLDDGVFSDFTTVYGQSIYGVHEYQEDDALDPNRISVYGAGKYGTVIYRTN